MNILSYLKEHLWNPIPAGIETLSFDKTVGTITLNMLKGLAPYENQISSKMHALGFVWNSDPLGGMVDFHSYPWVVCAKKKADCDDYSHLWYEILRGHGNRWILSTHSKSGKGHSMCVWQKRDNEFVLLSNLDPINRLPTRDALKNIFYGADTAYSYFE